MNILLNGAGRIGRCIVRKLIFSNKVNLVQINDPNLTLENLAYLINYDSIYGKLKKKISCKKNFLIIGKKKILFTREKNLFANKVNQKINLVIESSGIKKIHNLLKKKSKQNKFKSIITHTYDKSDINLIFGVNDHLLDKMNHNIISASICDAVATGPIIKIIDDNFKISDGSIITLHPWLSYQNLIDGPSRSFAYPGEIIENFSLGRASTETLIPKSTSCVKALSKSMPNIEKKFISMSVRVPTQIVSAAILNFKLSKKINKILLNREINKFINRQSFNIISINKDQCISKDFIANKYSCIIDNRWTEVKENSLRIFIWYDNEYGYSSRVLDLLDNLKNEKI